VQKLLAKAWSKGDPSCYTKIVLMPTIDEAISFVQELSIQHGTAQILVKGGFKHVGGVLAIIEEQDI
jgi:hypothetical protein